MTDQHNWRDPAAIHRLLSWPSHICLNENDKVGQAQEADLMSLPLASHLLEIASAPGNCVLDPFGGVGTIGIAANRMGRTFIGCEIDPVRHNVGRSHLSSDSLWLQGSLTAFNTSHLIADALITSPPFGRKVGGRRLFDDLYYDEMKSVFARAHTIIREDGVAVIELMNWPEFPGGGELVFRFFEFVRELVFTSLDGAKISPTSSHTWITLWKKNIK
jgi:tRNA G10  N-methylase Trm11